MITVEIEAPGAEEAGYLLDFMTDSRFTMGSHVRGDTVVHRISGPDELMREAFDLPANAHQGLTRHEQMRRMQMGMKQQREGSNAHLYAMMSQAQMNIQQQAAFAREIQNAPNGAFFPLQNPRDFILGYGERMGIAGIGDLLK